MIRDVAWNTLNRVLAMLRWGVRARVADVTPDGEEVDRGSGAGPFEIPGEEMEALGLNVRATNSLRGAGVTSVADLLRLSESELLEIPNLGQRTAAHISNVLGGRGLELAKASNEGGAGSRAMVVERDMAERWNDTINGLRMSDRDWMVLKWRFGTGGRLTLREAADRVGVTRERIRQIEKAALVVVERRVDQLATGLEDMESLFEPEGTALSIATPREFVKKVRVRFGQGVTEEDVVRLLTVIRALGSLGVAEKMWPCLSFCACILSPAVEGHASVQRHVERVSRDARERRRQWSYRELAVTVLQEEGEPLHWREIADRCEALGRRRAFSASTCFNQIQADRRAFVRVGQGTYGLVEWGLERNETVNGVIASLLFESGKCLAYGEILHRATARQEIKKISVQMTLDLHPRFYRAVSGRYGLRVWLPRLEMQTLRTPKDLVESQESARRVSVAEMKGYNVMRILAVDRRRAAGSEVGWSAK